MNKISLFSYHKQNVLFNLNDVIINRDNSAYSYYLLRKILKQKGYDLSTQDINSISDSDAVIYHDMPKELPLGEDIKKSYLLLLESEVIYGRNWDLVNHSSFKKVFTWSDNLVDNKKYFKINFSHLFPNKINKDISSKKKFCALIAGNKRNSHENELYSARVDAIRWFEKNHIDEFDLYGVGWDKPCYSNKYVNGIMRRLPFLVSRFKNNYPSYKGAVISKVEVLSNYKFSICYENAKNIPGYITEKIFDCFFSGCVPIYWGANNITDHIPESCFIDKNKFKSYDSLYAFMKSMDDKTYLNYLDSIEIYLKSDLAKQFTAEYFSATIINEIIKDEI